MYGVEVFDMEGQFLESVEVPDGFLFRPRPVIENQMVVTVGEDEAGTIMVKRYRLVLPGEEGR